MITDCSEDKWTAIDSVGLSWTDAPYMLVKMTKILTAFPNHIYKKQIMAPSKCLKMLTQSTAFELVIVLEDSM